MTGSPDAENIKKLIYNMCYGAISWEPNSYIEINQKKVRPRKQKMFLQQFGDAILKNSFTP